MADAVTPETVLSDFNKCLTKAEDSWKIYLRKFEYNYGVYLRDERRRQQEVSEDKLYVEHVYQQVETIVPRLVVPDPRFDIEPREGQHDDNVKALRHKVNYDLDADDFVSKQVELAKVALICGVAVTKVIWEHRTSNIRVHDFTVAPMDVLSGAKTTKVIERTDKNGPSMIPVNLWDFFPDPAATSIENSREVFHRTWLTKSELEQRATLMSDGVPIYKDIEKALKMGPAGEANKNIGNEPSDVIQARRGDSRYEVIERWRRGRLTVVVNRSVVVRDCANPYWHGHIPFCAASTQPDIRSFVGISEVEVIENIARMIHKFENMRMRAAEFAVNPVLKIHRALKGGQNIKWLPGEKIYLDRLDQITPESAPINLQAGWDEVQAYLGYMQQVSGVSPYITGADPAASGVNQNTATGSQILKEGADTRIRLKLLQMQVMYSKVAKMFVALNQQFMTKPELIKIAGPDGEQWISVKPEDIAGQYTVSTSNIAESLSRQAENQRLTQAVQTLMPMHGIPMADGTVVDIKYVLHALLDNIGIDPDKAFANAPPPQPDQGQQPQSMGMNTGG